MFDRISMIGLGYIGLPTAALFAARGVEVIGVDVSPKVVETINAGKIHIVEPELDGIVHKAVTDGNLRATLEAEPAEAFVIAVPTPFREGYEPDLSYIQSAANMIAPVLKAGDLVVLESTSPIGATEQMAAWLAEARQDLSFPQDAGNDADVQVAHCPERVLPGHVVRELVENDRIIGGMTERASEMAIAMYKKVVQGDCIVTDAKTAEMCKLTENSSRDVQIAFANELSVICDKFDIDVWELISLANRHPRVNILQPGAGVGGHCIAVDPWFIVASAPEEAKLIRAARDGNDGKPKWVLQKVRDAVMDVLAAEPSRSMEDIKVACLGLAFKPDIDDLRESPALGITAELSKLGCQVLAVEPHIEALPSKLGEGTIKLTNLENALEIADVACVLVKHSAFCELKNTLPEGLKVIDVVGL
ncbi:UDP-N-acetyl-D-mannosamine dehydrogenase [Phaeobacter italicus]|jgi:UDP-N-acetyl-D-mannosaminuronic acid dehydrogenase|uniref:UDP-N-acetyl-D-mannosamine dehydrogenase n=1 Tax=Phaeobacter italicus TaxID=481446 RepID=UPI001CD4A393|nr:UDP-N-acetyl-D-mannosamine dehydrogenase [Phaeobacter italicus]MCA0858903.1 UDP-N-acetyl-D-mannosamine dehydrogenase [Phaeobacter italicus]GLO76537.1 UDP-N-acetyl-D-mannosamine dehydrogenase [Phaeobacter italicus]